MIRKLILVTFLIFIFGNIKAQDAGIDWYINTSINCYIPTGDSEKSVFPVIGFNKNTSPKVLLGGIGFGIAAWVPVSNHIYLKPYLNLSKLTYWDDPMPIRDPVSNAMGHYQSWSSDYTVNPGIVVHYELGNQFSVGTGIAAHVMAVSLIRLPDAEAYYGTVKPGGLSMAKNYKRINPVVPLEASYRLNQLMLNLRYEMGLLNKLRGDLGKSTSEKFGVFALEVGFKL
jgi:hypothetical protein